MSDTIELKITTTTEDKSTWPEFNSSIFIYHDEQVMTGRSIKVVSVGSLVFVNDRNGDTTNQPVLSLHGRWGRPIINFIGIKWCYVPKSFKNKNSRDFMYRMKIIFDKEELILH